MTNAANENPAVEVTDAKHANRYEARIDGELAGFLEYVVDGDVVTMPHTEVDPRFEGRGAGSALASSALDSVRGVGGRGVPTCSFVASYIERHPEYADLVAEG
ncbi:acetyltransferase [Actinomyces radicidentis]|uniref:Acetyltransferase n=1 Tax=Actinomyces radicidentis TaxID=111015 RepID=A0A109W261_ACTRD|nr:GNAT family N-acetyltransferase [Actinomyces radicidentis]AMD86630.1 acetyltransferase [Actinomyces radicidentis]